MPGYVCGSKIKNEVEFQSSNSFLGLIYKNLMSINF